MIALLSRYGGVPNAATPGYLRDTELAARMFAEESAGRLPNGTVRDGNTGAEEVLDPAASAGSTDVLRMALERIDWQSNDPRWFGILASPLCFWNHIPWIYSEKWDLDRSTYLQCFEMVLRRCHANMTGRFGMTILHYAAASYNWIEPEERAAFVRMLLDRGSRIDVRDDLLRSTPLVGRAAGDGWKWRSCCWSGEPIPSKRMRSRGRHRVPGRRRWDTRPSSRRWKNTREDNRCLESGVPTNSSRPSPFARTPAFRPTVPLLMRPLPRSAATAIPCTPAMSG